MEPEEQDMYMAELKSGECVAAPASAEPATTFRYKTGLVLTGVASGSGINEIAQNHHDWVERMGWHNKTPLEALALIASEVGEAVNECRGSVPTDRLGEELADIILRVADLAHSSGVDLAKEITAKMATNEARGTRGRVF